MKPIYAILVGMQPFPKDFLWGASTASHQVEGNTHNQWSEWEHANAERLARTAGQRLRHVPCWQEIKSRATTPENYLSGTGVDHYHRFREDFTILQKLNMNAFRFGIEWSRIEPQPGQWDETAIEHYREYLADLASRNIEPVLTLWHWTMPTWFTDMGGFEKRKNIKYFTQYVAKVAEVFGKQLRYVITLNEPNVYVGFGYGNGEWPPNKKRPLLAIRVYKNLMLAHRHAYEILKAVNPGINIGIAAQLANTQPAKLHSLPNKVSVSVKRYVGNWWFIHRIRNYQDFIGINYYFTEYTDWLGRVKNPAAPLSDLGWYMEPRSIAQLLQDTWQKFKCPIIITENGLADAHDLQREWWITETLAGMDEARTAGVEIHGYLHWSLLDNFEWAYGWWPEFGLVHVDRQTMRRTIRPSAYTLAGMIAEHLQQAQVASQYSNFDSFDHPHIRREAPAR